MKAKIEYPGYGHHGKVVDVELCPPIRFGDMTLDDLYRLEIDGIAYALPADRLRFLGGNKE